MFYFIILYLIIVLSVAEIIINQRVMLENKELQTEYEKEYNKLSFNISIFNLICFVIGAMIPMIPFIYKSINGMNSTFTAVTILVFIFVIWAYVLLINSTNIRKTITFLKFSGVLGALLRFIYGIACTVCIITSFQ